MISYPLRWLPHTLVFLLLPLLVLIQPLKGASGNGGNFIGNGSLSGRVTEKGKTSGVAGASVYIADLKLGVIADSGGNYLFKSLPSGTYLVEVHSVGFKTVTKSIAVNGLTVANFELSDEYVEESQVVVTGLSKATQIKRSPVPIVSVNHQYIVTNLSSNIIDAIAKVPGVNALTTGPNISKPYIRGLGYNRILTLFDGIRQEGQQWGDEHGIEVDQYGIDHVEIVKGPASLTYGSDALAGVVNLIPTQPAPEGHMVGDVLAEYQTNNGMFGGSAMLSGSKKGWEWIGRLSHKQATNYQDPIDGRVYNTAFNETDGSLFVGLHRDWGYTHLGFSVFDDLQEIPDGSRDSATRQFTKQITNIDTFRPIVTPQELNSYAMTPLHQHVQYYRAYSANNFILGDGRLVVNLAYTRSVRREYDKPQEPDLAGLFLQLNTYSYDLKYYFPEFQGWNLTAGVNGMYQDNTVTNGTNFVIPSYHQLDIGPFIMAKQTYGKLDLSGGVRFDSRAFNNYQLYTTTDSSTLITTPVYGADTVGADKVFSNYSHLFSGFSGSLGATYNFTEKFSVKANLARGYRAPNIAEISANGVHPGTNIYQIGNSNFVPEFNLQEDIGFGYSSPYVVINFSVFNNRISNYIFNEKLLSVFGGDSVIVKGNQTFKYQQGKADLYGGELSIDIHPVKEIHFENVISAVYGVNLDIPAALRSDSNKYVAMIPPLHGISEISYNFDQRLYHLVNAFVKVQLAYWARQNRVYLTDNTETPTSCYNLVNIGLGGGITNAKGKVVCNLYILGNNIFDIGYQDHLSRLKYFEFYPTDPRPNHGIYNEGKNFSIKLDFPLDFAYK
jgi:iron complex outermembrane recepter protein